MPAFLLIGIPIIVAVLLIGILNLPDEDVKSEVVTKKAPAKKTAKKRSRK